MPEPTRKSPRPPYFLIFLCLLIMGAAVGVILDRRGPCQGWIAKLRTRFEPPVAESSPVEAKSEEPEQPTATPVAIAKNETATPTAKPVTDKVIVPSEEEPAQAPVPLGEKSDLEKRYEELYNQFLAEADKPRIGKTYELTLQRGNHIRGKLEKIEPGMVTMRLKYGTMAYPVHVLSRKDVLKLFPEIAARTKAFAALRGQSEPEETVANVEPQPTETLVVQPATAAPKAKTSTGQLRYDPTPGPTPEELKPTLLAFGEWLKGQHRRVGGRIADKIFARSQAGCAVLYLRMDPTFLEQDYGTRFQIAEGIQTFWGLRCESNGVATVARAHVVLLDQTERIIGGSRPYAASEIWLSKK